jgi:hypothetical protein
MRLVADGVVKAQEHLIASAILADRKDEAAVVCSTLQRGAVQLIVKWGHRVVTGIIAVISVVTGEDVIDSISRCHVVRVEVEDHTIVGLAMGRLIGRGRTPEKKTVHISQRTFWHGTVWSYRTERVDRTNGRGRNAAGTATITSPSAKPNTTACFTFLLIMGGSVSEVAAL